MLLPHQNHDFVIFNFVIDIVDFVGLNKWNFHLRYLELIKEVL